MSTSQHRLCLVCFVTWNLQNLAGEDFSQKCRTTPLKRPDFCLVYGNIFQSISGTFLVLASDGRSNSIQPLETSVRLTMTRPALMEAKTMNFRLSR
jgi:hypothetical protein